MYPNGGNTVKGTFNFNVFRVSSRIRERHDSAPLQTLDMKSVAHRLACATRFRRDLNRLLQSFGERICSRFGVRNRLTPLVLPTDFDACRD